MSLYDYKMGQQIAAKDYDFAALIQAAMRKADTYNLAKLQTAFPEIYGDLTRRYSAPGGVLEDDN